MRLSTALRVAGVIVVVKAVLIGLVYWRRAEIIGKPVDLAVIAWIALGAAAVLIALMAVAATVARNRGSRPPSE